VTHISTSARCRQLHAAERAMTMRIDPMLSQRFPLADDEDPRESIGAEVIELSTRNVLPSVSQRKPRSDGLG